MADSIKLNLGSGHKKLSGFVNVDMSKSDSWCNNTPDVVADIFEKLPFPDEYADEVHGYHVFEHVVRHKSDAVLRDWIRVLKPGGLLILELPCLDKILHLFNYFIERDKAPPAHLTLWGLYGDPKWKSDAMYHRWCYSGDELRGMMEREGLEVTFAEPQTHQPLRDMRLEGRKLR